ncbi:MAG: fibronectin type III domain-containing protein [Ruminococcus sp.]|nr:fibronectin type III domain-containing protein [Ruminococcus sp.]
MELKKRAVSLAACAVMLMSAGAPIMDSAGVFEPPVRASAKAAAESEIPAQAVIKSYSAYSTSVTIKWKKIPGVKGYRVYKLKGGKYKKVKDVGANTLSLKVTGLKANTGYTFKVRGYKKDTGGNTIWGKTSKAYVTTTAPVSNKAYKIKSVSVKPFVNEYGMNDKKITLKWGRTDCTGYALYVYNSIYEEWEKVAAVKGADNTKFTFYGQTLAKGQKLSLNYAGQGANNGYRFCVRPYNKDSAGNGKAYAKCFKASEAYYDITELEEFYGDEYKLLAKMLPKAKTGVATDSYDFYTTSKNKKTGEISSVKQKYYVSDKSKKVYAKFAKAHFKSGWTDAQKILYTLNWINRNIEYDYYGKAGYDQYLENVLEEKLGACDSYNGAISEMLSIMGYKGYYLQCMDHTSWTGGGPQHYRTEIKIGKKTYSFETGEGNWYWLFREYDQVPLSKKAK